MLESLLAMLERWESYTDEVTRHKKWSFPLRVSSVNVTQSADSCINLLHLDEFVVKFSIVFIVAWYFFGRFILLFDLDEHCELCRW